MAEKIEVLEIDTGQSVKTLKQLKDEIKSLRSTLEGCEIGTDKFTSTLDELTAAQNELKNATKTTKQTLEGSYDALVAKMGELKKAWKATNDEIERTNIGEQIADINNQLKGMDASIGNHQRKVGDYKDDIVAAFNEMKSGTVSYGEAVAGFNKQTEVTKGALEGVGNVASGVAGGFAAFQGIMALTGIESENFEKVMVKLNAAMAIAQGVGGMKGLIEGYGRLKPLLTAATAGVKSFNAGLSATKKAIIATGIGALIVAVGLLIANFDKIKKLFDKTTPEEKAKKALAEVRGEVEKLVAQAAGSKIAKFKELGRIFNDLGNNLNAKKQFVTQYASELANMGIKMNDVNTAEKIFNDKTGKYVQAVMARAKADAARAAASKKYAEYFEKEAELNVAIKKAEADPVTAGEENRSFWQGFDAYFGIRNSGENYWQKSAQQGQDHIASLKAQKEALSQEREDVFNDLMNEAKAYDEVARNILGGLYVSGIVSGGDGTGGSGKTDGSEEALANAKSIAERARKALIDTEKEELAELQIIYKEEEALLRQHGIATANLVDEYEKNKAEIEEKYRKKKEQLDSFAFAKAKEYYEEKVAASEKRLSTILSSIDKDAEQQMYNNERRKPKYTGDEASEIDNELKKIETLRNIYKQVETDSVAAIEKEQSLFNKTTERWIELENQRVTIKEQTNRKLAELDDQYAAQHKKKTKTIATNTMSAFSSALDSATQIISALQESIDTTTEEGFKKNKKLQIVNATLSMLSGIVNAISSAMTIPPPMGPIMGAINAATVATVGGIQIAQIKKQTFGGNKEPDSVQAPTINTAALMSTPINYTTEVKGAQAIEDVADTRVFVVESDITDTIRKVEVAEEESTF